MWARTRGQTFAGNGSSPWAGKAVLWPNWHAFRAWSIANGYCAARNSLDRFFDWEDYGPDTCRWLSVSDNTKAMTRGVCAPIGTSDRMSLHIQGLVSHFSLHVGVEM